MSEPTLGGFDPQPCPTDGPAPGVQNFSYTMLCDTDTATGTVFNVVTQQTEYDDAGNPIGIKYYDATTGAEYTPIGTITDCSFSAGPQVEILCEFKTNGDVIQFIRRYTELDTGATLVQDSTLGGDQTYDVDPTSTVGLCPQVGGCDPVTTTGLCLPGGVPIATVLRRDCDTGVITLDGYINLLSGVFAPGPPPMGTVACGTSESVQVSGTFCSVDSASGDVLALVLVEYTYAPNGTIESTRLVNAVDGTTYTVPVGAEITTCPAGVDAPDSDGLALCDDNGVFLRDFRRDENGTLVSYSDYTLTLAPYVPVGTVRVCQPTFPDPECCPDPVSQVCLANGNPGVIIRAADGSLSRVDTVTGLPFAAGDIVPCAPYTNRDPVELCYQGPGGADDVRHFLRHFTYTASGTIAGYTDTDPDGTPVTVAAGAAFSCDPDALPTTYTEVFNVVPGSPWLFSSLLTGYRADSVTVTVIEGTATVDGSGTNTPVSLPPGMSVSWTRSPSSEQLAGPTSVTAAVASRAIVHYTASLALP